MTEPHANGLTGNGWSSMSKALHWVIAALIIMQVVLAQLAKRAAESNDTFERLALLSNHKSLGLTVLLLVIVRIGWRLTHRPAALPSSMSGWQRTASHLSHAGLYLLMLVLPLSGWIMAAASTYGLSWFNLFEVPRIMAPNHDLHELGEEVHEILAYVLVAFVLLHIAAAAFHHLIIKDTVLRRMSSRFSVGLFVVLLGGLTFLLTPGSNTADSATDAGAATRSVAVNTSDQATENLAGPAPSELWDIDYERSFIRFTGEQAGAQFTGLWTHWHADISIIPEPLAVHINVEIDADNANTDDEERDSTLKDSDWFDVTNYPVARFVLNSIKSSKNGGYTGVGQLTIKDQTTPTEFTFTVDTHKGTHTLTGQARLDRLELNIGTGEWADTSWVGQYVDVDVLVVTK